MKRTKSPDFPLLHQCFSARETLTLAQCFNILRERYLRKCGIKTERISQERRGFSGSINCSVCMHTFPTCELCIRMRENSKEQMFPYQHVIWIPMPSAKEPNKWFQNCYDRIRMKSCFSSGNRCRGDLYGEVLSIKLHTLNGLNWAVQCVCVCVVNPLPLGEIYKMSKSMTSKKTETFWENILHIISKDFNYKA